MLVKKIIIESIVAVSKLNTKYAVMLITASYCLSAVEANDNNQTDPNSQSDSKDSEDKSIEHVGAIVGIVVGILGFMLAALTFYCQHIKAKEQKYTHQQVFRVAHYLWKEDAAYQNKTVEVEKLIDEHKLLLEIIRKEQNPQQIEIPRNEV